jgi:hypothetical protein
VVFAVISSALGQRGATEPRTTVAPLSGAGAITDGSIPYALPRTVFTIKVDMERSIEIPGPYARYAAEFLGINDAIRQESESWAITAVIVSTHEEADPSEYYIISGNAIMQSNALALRKEGLILDINPSQFLITERQTVGGVRELDQFRFTDLGANEYFYIQRDTAYRRTSIDSTFIRVPYLDERRQRLTAEQLAESAARRIMELRDGKHLILTGESSVYPQSDAGINEANRLEKAYTELFAGKVVKEKRSHTVTFIPEPGMERKSITLFQFSETTGPVTESTARGVAIVAELIPEQKTKALNVINNTPTQGAASDKLFYRAPDIATLKISMGREVLFNSRKMVYQFGEIVQLPANFILLK